MLGKMQENKAEIKNVPMDSLLRHDDLEPFPSSISFQSFFSWASADFNQTAGTLVL